MNCFWNSGCLFPSSCCFFLISPNPGAQSLVFFSSLSFQVISFSFLALNNFFMPVTPHLSLFLAWTSPLSSRFPYPIVYSTSWLGYLVGIAMWRVQASTSNFPPQTCSSHSLPTSANSISQEKPWSHPQFLSSHTTYPINNSCRLSFQNTPIPTWVWIVTPL